MAGEIEDDDAPETPVPWKVGRSVGHFFEQLGLTKARVNNALKATREQRESAGNLLLDLPDGLPAVTLAKGTLSLVTALARQVGSSEPHVQGPIMMQLEKEDKRLQNTLEGDLLQTLAHKWLGTVTETGTKITFNGISPGLGVTVNEAGRWGWEPDNTVIIIATYMDSDVGSIYKGCAYDKTIAKLKRHSLTTTLTHGGHSSVFLDSMSDATVPFHFGYDPLVDTLRRYVDRSVQASKSAARDLDGCSPSQTRKVLLIGPPGTGKTTLVQRVCHDLNLLCCTVSCGEPGSSMNHHAAHMLNIVDCDVLLLDDIDRLGSSVKLVIDRVNLLMPGLKAIFFTCNEIEGLDPALLRPGRVDRVFEVPAPDAETRRVVLETYVRDVFKVPIPDKIDDLIAATDGLTQAHLYEIARSLQSDPYEEVLETIRVMRRLKERTKAYVSPISDTTEAKKPKDIFSSFLKESQQVSPAKPR